MVKLLLAAVLSSGFLSQGETMQPPTINLTPLPPMQGESLNITYSGTPGTTLDLDWDPAGTPTKVKVDANGEATVTVPDNATSLVVIDPTVNGAANQSTTITPS